MSPARRVPRPGPAVLAVAALLLATVTVPALARGERGGAGGAAEAALRGRCTVADGLGLLVSPEHPEEGQPLRVVVVSETPRPGATLVGRGPSGLLELHPVEHGGPPHVWIARPERPAAGVHRFALLDRDGRVLACRQRSVEHRHATAAHHRRVRPEGGDEAEAAPGGAGPWPIRRAWGRVMENLYSAWVEALFDAPATEQPSWTPLHLVVRDPARNLLYNHLGADEDGPDAARAVLVQPDCADLPYFLRAYFAWKLGLPFGYRHCDRGSSTRPATCGGLLVGEPGAPRVGAAGGASDATLAARFSRYLRSQVGLVHSGSGRTGPDDDETDLYPVALDRRALRPGVVYVDPYGHLLVLAKWVDQPRDSGGILFAVDGHPDLSVGRKRFWRGAFLFSDKIQAGAGGFKAFRPLAVRRGQLEALTNAEIRSSADYGNHSKEQYTLGIEGFYDRMDRIINPRPLPPLMAYRERLVALHELVLERVGSVQAGEDFFAKSGGKAIEMPRGPKIFETKGAWEDFSTPARDMRLLIAIEEVLTFPGKVAAQPRRFSLPEKQDPAAARRELEALFKSFTAEKGFAYKKSDGSSQKVTLAELVARRRGLEVSYNPNDCPEVRWAAEGTELASCSRHAPAAQRALMESYRVWFATKTRPPLR
jgi:hypothetical protein